MERSSPRGCGGRRCNGGRTATMTGGGGVGFPRRRTIPGWPGPLDGGNRSGRFLRRGWGGQHGSGNTGGRQLLGGDSPAAMVRVQIRRAPGHGEDWDEQWRLGETRESGRGQEKGVKGPWRAGRWQRIPCLPRFVATRPHPGAGELLEGERRLGGWPVGPRERERGKPGVLRGGPRSAAGRPDRREGKTEEARGRGKKHLTGGTGLAEAVSGCSREGRRAGSGWAVEGKRERGRGVGLRTGPGKWARARPTREKRKEGRGCWALGDLGQGREGERGFD
jgi:hypothetical protein